MNLTDNMKARILNAIRVNDNLTQTGLAQAVGLGKTWASKLIKPLDEGGLKSLSDEQVDAIEEYLGITLLVITPNRRVSGTAAKLSELAENDQSLSLILENLLAFVDDLEKRVPGPRYFETKEMNPLGEKITEIVDTCRGKKGKIAREVIKLITE